MYRDLNSYHAGKRFGGPRKGPPRLTTGQQKVLIWAVVFELFMLFISPSFGISLVSLVEFITSSQ